MYFRKVFFLFFIFFRSYAYECYYEDYYKPKEVYSNSDEDYYKPEYIAKLEDDDNFFKKENTFSINSAYFGQQTNSQQLTEIGLELINISNYFVENISQNNTGIKILTCGISLYCSGIYNLAIHEMGHGLRMRALGLNFRLRTEKDKSKTFSKREDFISYYLRCLAAMEFSGSTSFNLKGGTLDPYENLVISAAGVNNEMLFAEKISEAKQQEKLDDNWITNANYYWNKISPLYYAQTVKENSTNYSHDINSVLKAYRDLNLNIKKQHIQTAYIIAFLGGSLSDNIFKAARQYDEENSLLKKINTPDIFAYLTSYGVSYKFTTGYKLNDLTTLKMGLEFVMHGKSKKEVSLGFIKRFRNNYKPEMSAMLFFGCEGIDLELSGSILLGRAFRLKGGYGMYTVGSLYGERLSKNIYKIADRIAATKEGKTYYKNSKKKTNYFWFGISYVF